MICRKCKNEMTYVDKWNEFGGRDVYRCDHCQSHPMRVAPTMYRERELTEDEKVGLVPEWARPYPIIRDERGVVRFKKKPLVEWLCDRIDLNEMWAAYREGAFSKDEFMQFYRDIGYSILGFIEIWYEELPNELPFDNKDE